MQIIGVDYGNGKDYNVVLYGSIIDGVVTVERELFDYQPCDHPGCLSHVSHPCEGCGRIAGRASSVAAQQRRAAELPSSAEAGAQADDNQNSKSAIG